MSYSSKIQYNWETIKSKVGLASASLKHSLRRCCTRPTGMRPSMQWFPRELAESQRGNQGRTILQKDGSTKLKRKQKVGKRGTPLPKGWNWFQVCLDDQLSAVPLVPHIWGQFLGSVSHLPSHAFMRCERVTRPLAYLLLRQFLHALLQYALKISKHINNICVI